MSETENQVAVEPASEEKTETKEVKATKRATEVSISLLKLYQSNSIDYRVSSGRSSKKVISHHLLR